MVGWAWKKFKNASMATGITWSCGCRCVVASGYDGKLKWFDVSDSVKDDDILHAQLTGDERSGDHARPDGQAYVERNVYNNGYGANGYTPPVETSAYPEHWHESSGNVLRTSCASAMCGRCKLPIMPYTIARDEYQVLATVETGGRHHRFNQKGSVVGPGMTVDLYREQRKFLKEEADRISNDVYRKFWKDPFLKDLVNKCLQVNQGVQAAVDLSEVKGQLVILQETVDQIDAMRRSKYEDMAVLLNNGPMHETHAEDHAYELTIHCEGKLHVEKRWAEKLGSSGKSLTRAEKLSSNGRSLTTRFKMGFVDPFELNCNVQAGTFGVHGGGCDFNDKQTAHVQVVMTGVKGARYNPKSQSHIQAQIKAKEYLEELQTIKKQLRRLYDGRMKEVDSLKNFELKNMRTAGFTNEQLNEIEDTAKKALEKLNEFKEEGINQIEVGINNANAVLKRDEPLQDAIDFALTGALVAVENGRRMLQREMVEKGWRDDDYNWRRNKVEIEMMLVLSRQSARKNPNLNFIDENRSLNSLENQYKECFKYKNDLDEFERINERVKNTNKSIMDKILDHNKRLKEIRIKINEQLDAIKEMNEKAVSLGRDGREAKQKMKRIKAARDTVEKIIANADGEKSIENLQNKLEESLVQRDNARKATEELGISLEVQKKKTKRNKKNESEKKPTESAKTQQKGEVETGGRIFVWELTFLYSSGRKENAQSKPFMEDQSQGAKTNAAMAQTGALDLLSTGALDDSQYNYGIDESGMGKDSNPVPGSRVLEASARRRASRLNTYILRFNSKTKGGVYEYYSTARNSSLVYRHIIIKSSEPLLMVGRNRESPDEVRASYEKDIMEILKKREEDGSGFEMPEEEYMTVPTCGSGKIYSDDMHSGVQPSVNDPFRFKYATIPLEHVRKSHKGDRYAASSWGCRCIVYTPCMKSREKELDPLQRFEDMVLLRGHVGAVTHACWSPDDRFIATCSVDHTVRLWKSYSGNQLLIMLGHNGFLRAVEWSHNGHYIASGGDDGTLRIWDLGGWGRMISNNKLAVPRNCKTVLKVVKNEEQTDHPDALLSLAWSPKTEKLAVGWHSSEVEVYSKSSINGNSWQCVFRLDENLQTVQKEYFSKKKNRIHTVKVEEPQARACHRLVERR
jgi:hypothetical protein